MKKLYRFHWDCGRMGDVTGLFVSSPQEVREALGKKVYFGEILGKHSEIFGTLDEGDLEVISEDEDFVNKLVDILGGSVSGYNPLEYINNDEEEEYL